MTTFQEYEEKLSNIAKKTNLGESAKVLSQSQGYIDENRNILREQYEGCWIAVHKQQVVGANKDLYILIGSLRENNIPLNQVALEDLSSEDIPIVF